MDNLTTIIEGILFSANAPLSVDAIAKIFHEEERPAIGEIRTSINNIQEYYASRGIRLVEVASGFRFQVSQEVAPFILRTLEEKPARYSRALLETLALVAYRQPITRAEIEDIRGVAVSTNIMRTLTEQNWVRVVGYKEVPGKPALYATTKNFLDHFGLVHLEDLPPLAELKDLNAENITTSNVEHLSNQEEEDLDLEQDLESELESELHQEN